MTDESFALGRIAGVRVGVNWSVLVVFALLVWTLAVNLFPHHNAGLSEGTYVGMGVVAAALFFVSLLLHELGHAVAARREGMDVEGITLWLFGGVAKFKGMFPSAGAEFRIAIAGPLVTLGLGVLAIAVARTSLPPEIDGVASWLGYINLLLLGFNLLPALPLDGGRMLRAGLWRMRRDFSWATRIAAGVGRIFGYAMIVAGLFFFVFQGAFSGAWLAFVGWFLLTAAGDELRYVTAHEALAGLRVADVMVADPVVVGPDMTLGQFLDEVVWARRFTCYPVVENGQALGLLPFSSVAAVPRSEWDDRRVRDCLLPLDRIVTLTEDGELSEAFEELVDAPVKRALVLNGNGLRGLLSITDIARVIEVGRPSVGRA